MPVLRRTRTARRWRPSVLDRTLPGGLVFALPRASGAVLPAPQNLRLAPGGNGPPGGFLGLEWDAVVGATQYRVFWRRLFSDEPFDSALTGSAAPAYTIEGIDGSYDVKVAAMSGPTQGLESDVQPFSTWAPS